MLYTFLCASTFKHGWFLGGGVGVSIASIYVNPEYPSVKEKIEKNVPIKFLDPNMIKALAGAISLGGRPKFFGSLQLGYGWKIKNWWVDITTFFNYEYRNIKCFLDISAENLEDDRKLIQLRMQHAIQGGLDCRLGYYITPHLALLAFVGLEVGKQGTFRRQSHRSPFVEAPQSPLLDVGIRLGVQTRVDLKKNWGIVIGYQSVFLPVKGMMIYKNRSLVGAEYAWLS